jgi:hypothetical protein
MGGDGKDREPHTLATAVEVPTIYGTADLASSRRAVTERSTLLSP